MSDLENEKNQTNDEEVSLEDFLNQTDDKVEVLEKKKRTVYIEKRDNNSGQGEPAPYNIQKEYNWGAFLFNWLWGIRYRKWVLLLALVFLFIPYGYVVSFVISIIAGFKGNQWAWEEVQYENEEDFHSAQKQWVKLWGICAGVFALISIPIIISMSKNSQESTKNVEENIEISIDKLNPFNTNKLKMPEEVFEKTDLADKHSDFLTSDKFIIYWVREEDELATKNKELIENEFKENEETLKNDFILSYEIIPIPKKTQTSKKEKKEEFSLRAKCVNDYCIDTWLYKTCNTGYCILDPLTKTYIKIRGEKNIIPRAKYLQQRRQNSKQ